LHEVVGEGGDLSGVEGERLGTARAGIGLRAGGGRRVEACQELVGVGCQRGNFVGVHPQDHELPEVGVEAASPLDHLAPHRRGPTRLPGLAVEADEPAELALDVRRCELGLGVGPGAVAQPEEGKGREGHQEYEDAPKEVAGLRRYPPGKRRAGMVI
jgi:hypothetical protein